jgi:hypothetical protein
MALLIAFALSVSWHRHLNPSQERLDGIQMKINSGSGGGEESAEKPLENGLNTARW